jgi:hypothetical protein
VALGIAKAIFIIAYVKETDGTLCDLTVRQMQGLRLTRNSASHGRHSSDRECLIEQRLLLLVLTTSLDSSSTLESSLPAPRLFDHLSDAH